MPNISYPFQRLLLGCLLLCLAFSWPIIAEEYALRILHTSDLHANLTGDSIAPTSFAQLATVLHQLREDAPGAALHIDTGDTIEGSLAGAICKGRPILEALAQMGCDIWVPGNHEFDFGCPNFLELAKDCPLRMLCGNLWPQNASPEERYPAWAILECGPARIAIIGLTASYLPNWYLSEFSEIFEVEKAVDTLRRILPEIHKTRPDAIILGIHQGHTTRQSDPRGVNEVARIGFLFPEIDLVLGGHTHRAFPGSSLGHGTWYLQPAAHGEYIGVADLLIDTSRHCVKRITSHLVQPVLETTPDTSIQEFLQPVIDLETQLRKEVLHAPLSREISAKGQPGLSCPASELICQALAEATEADVALHGTLSSTGLPAGQELTGADLFSLVPYENTAITALVTPKELETIISEQWKHRKVYSYCGLWGATAQIDADGNAHLTAIGPALTPPEPDRRYRLVLNSHTAAGSGRNTALRRILSTPAATCTDTRLLTRDLLRTWLLQHPEDFQIRPKRWLQPLP